MKKVAKIIENFATLALLILLILVLFPACDCGSSNDNADGLDLDDDSVFDDDSTIDDDGDDDASTTTTSPTTTTTAPPTSSTTTTVVTTTTTTTTRPGEGSACDPFVEDPEVIDREKPFGPWPEFEERGITFRQIISSGAGQGQNDILFTSDGLARVAAQDGRSLDVIAVGPAGEVSREVVDPRGGEWKVLGKDADDHLYMAYTVHTDQYPETWELRAATNKSGSWVRETLFTSLDDATLSFDMAVDAAGLMHIVFTGRDESAVAYYATWDGDTYTETQIATSPGGWRYIYALALDSTGSPHALFSESTGTWHWRIEDSAWVGDLATGNAFAWDLVIDANGVLHAGLSANGGHLVYGKLESGAWSFEDLDDCQDGVSFISLRIDGAGHLHISYTDGNQNDVLYATNASGEWIHTFLYEEVDTESADLGHAWDMSSALDADGKIHIVHRRYNDYYYARNSDLNLATNASGEWVRRRLIKGSALGVEPGVMDQDDRVHFVFRRSRRYEEPRALLVYGLLDGVVWAEEVIDSISGPGWYQDAAIALDEENNPYVLYGKTTGANGDVDELIYGRRIGADWQIQTLADTGDIYSNTDIQLDSAGSVHAIAHTVYSSTNHEIQYWHNTTGTWEYEVVPGPDRFAELLIDSSDHVSAGYTSDNGNEIHFAQRQSSLIWIDKIALATMGRVGLSAADIRPNDLIDFIYASVDASTPDGYYYATEESGVWTSLYIGLYGGGGRPNFILDANNKIHAFVYAVSGFLEQEQTGVYYATNMRGEFERFFVDGYIGDMHPIGIHQSSEGRLFVYYDYFGGQALMTATFEPGME